MVMALEPVTVCKKMSACNLGMGWDGLGLANGLPSLSFPKVPER